MYPDRVVNYEYDRLDRMNTRCFVNGGVPVYNSYQYYVRQNAPSESNVVYRTTQLLREIVDNTGYTYTYDDVGNILTVKTSQRLYPNTSNVEIGEHSDYRSYSYDNKYQLTRENNVTSGKTTVWGYDELGNITSKTEYPYTQGALGTALSTVNYTYSNDGKNGWNKLLTAVGNETVTYDAIGNPTSYLGASLSWFGRKLQSYEKGNTSVTYTYDAGGSRASKTVNGTKSEFVYLDGKLVYEKRGGDDIFYLYDSYGNISNIRWYKNGASSPTNIYVITNRQGDVLGLYDYAGRRKVSYEYDAWGNTVSVTDTSEDCWSTLNPFRYRGYYFDTETGLYYLLSRYYDPAVGRFINADSLISQKSTLGFNVFAYCNNSPVNMSDSTGHLPKWLRGALNIVSGAFQFAAGAALGATVGWTGVGAVAAALLVANGVATTMQGIGQVVNSVANKEVLREDNFIRTGVEDVGRLVAGDTGAAVAGVVYDTAITAASMYAGINTKSGCFIAGTAILTGLGARLIENIEKGDLVWAKDPQTGEVALKRVVQTFVHESNELVNIVAGGEVITATTNHPFYVASKGWTAALELRAGDMLVRLDGTYVIVEFVQHEILENPIKVYNFEVEDFHTYFVGTDGLLVHNKCVERIGKQRGKAPRDNQKQNKQADDLATKYKLNKDQQQMFHRDVYHMGYSYSEMEQELLSLFPDKKR